MKAAEEIVRGSAKRPLIACVAYGTILTAWVLGRWLESHGQANDPGWLMLVPVQATAAFLALRLVQLPELAPMRRLGWALMGAAFVADMLAIVDWNAIFMSNPEPLGTSADGLYFANYAMLSAACIAFFLDCGGSFRGPRAWLDFATLMSASAAFLLPCFIHPVLVLGRASGMGMLAVVSYGIGVATAATSVSLLAMQVTGWRRDRAMLFVVGGIGVGLITDVASLSANIRGLFRLENFDDLGSSWAYVLFVLAALVERRTSARARASSAPGSLHGFLPMFSVLAAASLLVAAGGLSSAQYRWIACLLVLGASTLLLVREQLARRERMAQYEMLAAHEADLRFAELVRFSTDMIVLADASSRVTFLSPAAEKLLFPGSQAVLGQPIHTILGAAHEATLAALLKELREVSDGISVEEVNFASPNVAPRVLQVIARMDSPRSRLTGIVLTFCDVTGARFTERAVIAIAAGELRVRSEMAALVDGGRPAATASATHGAAPETDCATGASQDPALSYPLSGKSTPSTPQYDALMLALHSLVAEVNRYYGVSATLAINADPRADLTGAHRIYRIVRDAIGRAMHQRCRFIRVTVTGSEDVLALSVHLNEPRSRVGESESADALVQRLLQFEAQRLGGTLSVDIPGPHGAVIELRVPISAVGGH